MITQIRPSQLAEWIASKQVHGEAMVLDVREPNETAVASIKQEGFRLVSIPMGLVPLRLHELDASQPIACLCHHGARSMQVANFLHSRGFEHVANISGGINAWSTEVDSSVPTY